MNHWPWIERVAPALLVASIATAGCDDDEPGGDEGAAAGETETSGSTEGDPEPPERERGGTTETAVPDSLPEGLLLAYAQFEVEGGKVTAKPGPARVELLYREAGQWETRSFEDPESNVFHKAMVFDPPQGEPGFLTLGGDAAALKLWRAEGDGFEGRTLWKKDFGGEHSRMRDAEVADLDGDGRPEIAVGTHDQGVVAVIHSKPKGGWKVQELDRSEDTFIHEIEIGDLDDDGVLEVYATPSDPNKLEGGETQRGKVMRYVPKTGEKEVVAKLGNRHAKEIYVDDVDGDGTDELYVAIEALTDEDDSGGVKIVEPVEIRRYDADTKPDEGARIATIDDRLTRFLTVGDLDGDGDKEMVAAAFRSGLWLLEPGTDPRTEWGIQNIDRNSSGFEHASLVADLDADGMSELYVAADDQGEIRRYVWRNHQPHRSTIHSRKHAKAMLTWNLMPFPVSMIEADEAGTAAGGATSGKE